MNKWEFIKENYIDKGLKIFPVIPNGKTPMIEKWQEECSSDYFQVLYWYNSCPDCNWALPATQNNLFVLDLDRHDEEKDGVENFGKLLKDLNVNKYITTCQHTPSSGMHYIYKTDDDLKNVSNSSNIFKDYAGIDCRTDGYIVVEPSETDKGIYQFEYNEDINEMPQQLKQFILENANLKNSVNKQPYKKPTYVDVGDRDNQLFSYINSIYYKTRLDYDEILCLANHFNETVFEKPLPERDVRYKVKKVFDKDRSTMIFINLDE
jgi:hypothetical protein